MASNGELHLITFHFLGFLVFSAWCCKRQGTGNCQAVVIETLQLKQLFEASELDTQ